MSIAQIVESVVDGPLPLRVEAYDGSAAGPDASPVRLRIENQRGVSYLATAPGDLGMARAYVVGDLTVQGVHPGDPYELLTTMASLRYRRPGREQVLELSRMLGLRGFTPPPPPPQESLPRWRRLAEGLRHSSTRDAEAIHHHYDVSNRFYEMVLGPSMTYTCACYPSADATLEEAQENKYRLVFDKLALKPGDRLLDIGCGWGGMVRYAARRGVSVLGVTLSREQALWAQKAIAEEGLADLAEVRHSDYRAVTETGFDAVSSIGLTEHIGVRNYPAYFGFIRDRLRVGGLLLNHCITRPHNKHTETGAFIDRYVFPDGELTGSGRIITEAQDVGLEVLHEENLREHYAKTLAGWCANLVEHWDECVAEVGEGTARVWGLYMAGSRVGFERNEIQLHHVLAAKTDATGHHGLPLRPWWSA
ncbi:MAG: class I SAM-dependent methyltransferase [Micrococcales bacterium]|mgnify:CR=1 FL=1|uniref:class I SAM-dependent methyltransferase n=1 Tax=Phycicoccus sp. TaxID=1902410 RepID=UPI0019CC4362|nr:class I SAM-dependent methyltransferase [Phycicoccus sp.]MBD3781551.1 class I SAM-dependent methyltransferase [Micrococcales bacterium]HMM94727.1 class I SAM-dependent methyltransferase [Phycicoccus sp.]